jgi:hypothetical protein
MKTTMIAPCGVNCELCVAYQSTKRRCHGCFADIKMGHCAKCSIRFCENAASDSYDSCCKCKEFPCARLKRMDKTYRQKYHVSTLQNLIAIKEHGIAVCLKAEKTRWSCRECGQLICIHRGGCTKCGAEFIFNTDMGETK